MNNSHTEYNVNEIDILSKFKCLGPKCPLNCCSADFDVEIDPQTSSIYEYYLPEVNRNTITKNGRKIINKECGESCTYLQSGLCTIQNKVGDSALPDQCYFYPRIVNKMGDDIFIGACMSCPEISKHLIEENFLDNTYNSKKYNRIPSNINKVNRTFGTYHNYSRIHSLFVNLFKKESASIAIAKNILICQSLDQTVQTQWYNNFLQVNQIGLSGINYEYYDDINILRIIQFFVLLIKSSSTHLEQNENIDFILSILEHGLSLKVDKKTCEIISINNKIPDLYDNISRKQLKYIDNILNNYIKLQIHNTYFPYAAIGNNFTERANFLAIKYLIIKLLTFANIKNNNIDEQNIDYKVTQTISIASRYLDHINDLKMFNLIFDDYNWNNNNQFITIIKNV